MAGETPERSIGEQNKLYKQKQEFLNFAIILANENMLPLKVTYILLASAIDGGSVPKTLSHSDEVIPKPLVWTRK